jgi:hypothetical protein
VAASSCLYRGVQSTCKLYTKLANVITNTYEYTLNGDEATTKNLLASEGEIECRTVEEENFSFDFVQVPLRSLFTLVTASLTTKAESSTTLTVQRRVLMSIMACFLLVSGVMKDGI